MNKSIYTTTTTHKSGRNSRCFGFYFDEKSARKAVFVNRGNMQECYYSYLVIEKYNEGTHPIPEEIEWFKWQINEFGEGEWVKCKKPTGDLFDFTCNWAGIG